MKKMKNNQKKEKVQNQSTGKKQIVFKVVTIILAIILISMIGFVGIYTQKQNRMENIVRGYDLAMDLKGARVVSIKPKEDKQTVIKDSEGNKITEELTDEQIKEKGYTKEEVNKNADKLTKENFESAKTIIEKRLENLGLENYIVRLNEETGEIVNDKKVSVRTILLDADNKKYVTASKIFARSILNLIRTFGVEEIQKGVKIKIIKKSVSNSANKALGFELV